MPEITLPDKSKRKFENPLSIEDIASDIGPGLAKATVAGKIDGVLVDASEIVTKDAEIEIITAKDDEGIEVVSILVLTYWPMLSSNYFQMSN